MRRVTVSQWRKNSSVGKESACNAGDLWFNSCIRRIPWRRDRLPTPVFLGFPGGSDGRESTCNVGDLGLIPGLGRSPGGGQGNLLQYSCLENPHRQRSLVGYQSVGCKELDMDVWQHSTGWNMLCQPSLENRRYLAGWAVVLRACLSVSEGHKLITMVLEPVLNRAWVSLPAWFVVILDQALLHVYGFSTHGVEFLFLLLDWAFAFVEGSPELDFKAALTCTGSGPGWTAVFYGCPSRIWK